jgi:hypothetical protein
MELDAIRELARTCKREALDEARGGELLDEVDPKYLARLEALLGRPASEQEAYEFRVAFESPDAERTDKPRPEKV